MEYGDAPKPAIVEHAEKPVQPATPRPKKARARRAAPPPPPPAPIAWHAPAQLAPQVENSGGFAIEGRIPILGEGRGGEALGLRGLPDGMEPELSDAEFVAQQMERVRGRPTFAPYMNLLNNTATEEPDMLPVIIGAIERTIRAEREARHRAKPTEPARLSAAFSEAGSPAISAPAPLWRERKRGINASEFIRTYYGEMREDGWHHCGLTRPDLKNNPGLYDAYTAWIGDHPDDGLEFAPGGGKPSGRPRKPNADENRRERDRERKRLSRNRDVLAHTLGS